MTPVQAVDGAGPPARIGSYRIEERLGSGGMGAVYRAFDETLERSLALKRLLADGTDPVRRARFRREARAAARLNHPAIVHIYDIVETPDGDWIAMELVLGETLDQRLAAGPLGWPEAVRLGREILDGLACAHQHGILHRDLKATNIMVTRSGHAKILDFGLAKFLSEPREQGLSRAGVILGTVHAMSPEQAMGLPMDPRADLFSFGSLLYELLTGVSPFRAANGTETLARICSLSHRPVTALRPEVPSALSDLVDHLLAKAPEARPASAEVALAQLDGIVGTQAPGMDRETSNPAEKSVWIDWSLSEETVIERVPWKSRPSALTAEPPRPRESAPGTLGTAASISRQSRAARERRQVTVVCCELAGSFSGALDPEILDEVLPELKAAAAAVTRELGGHLLHVLGHRLVLCFGYPQADEHDAARAVRAARELAARVARLSASSAGTFGTPGLALRAGVHTGSAVVATDPGEADPLTLGPTLDLGLGLAALAGPGEVLLSPATQLLVRRGFTTEPMEPARLPGMDGPVTAHRVIAPAASPEETAANAPVAALIGREQELGLLLSRFQLAAEGMGQVVLVSGEAGIGKSRLVRAFRERLGEGATGWLSCYASPYLQGSPLHPMAALLRQAVAQDAGESGEAGEVSLSQLERFLDGLALASALPFLAPLLGLPLPGAAPLDLSPERQKEKTLEALVSVIVESAERRPLVLVIEDLHWFDPSSLGWLDRLLDPAATVPLLVLVTLRLQSLEILWGPRAHLTSVTLAALGTEEVERLIDRVAAGSDLPEGVRRQIVARTDGVPLFVEELTKAVLEAGLEAGDMGGGRLELPATLRDSLAARLDRLGPAKQVAQLAAVLGRSFTFEQLAAVSPLDETALQRELRQLVQAELVHRRGSGRAARYLFKHALVQDAAYDSLLKRERQQLHREIAGMLTARFPEVAATQPEILARHWTEAQEAEKAVDAWMGAGLKALAGSADVEAAHYLENGLRLVSALPADIRQRRELELLVTLGPALSNTRGFAAAEVEEVYQRAYELAEGRLQGPEQFRILLGLWHFYVVRADMEKARALGEQILALAEASGDRDLLEQAAYALGSTYFYCGDLAQGRLQMERGLDAEAPDRPLPAQQNVDAQVGLRSCLALALWQQGFPDQALARTREAVELGTRSQHLPSRAFGLNYTAYLHLLRREREACQTAADELRRLSEEKGLFWLPSSLMFLGWTLALSDDPAERPAGIAQIEGAFAAYQRFGARLGQSSIRSYLIGAYLHSGRAEEAWQAAGEGIAESRQTGELYCLAELHRLRGEARLAQGAPGAEDAAELDFREALAIARGQGARMFELRAAVSLARLERARGRGEEGRALLAGLLAGLTEGFGTLDFEEALNLSQEGGQA